MSPPTDRARQPDGPHDETVAFSAMFTRCAPRVFAYALRHVGASGAEDVVADTFLVAWRRRATLPADPLPWLLVTARKTIGNRRRGQLRHGRLVEAVAAAGPASHAPSADEAVVERDVTVAALADLSPLEREALLLVAWDGLPARDAAAVAGCGQRAFEVRVSRARARLGRSLAAHDLDPPRTETPTTLPARPRRTQLPTQEGAHR